MQYEVKKGFVSLPKGCYIQLEKKASEIILSNIRKTFGDRAGLVSRIKTFTEDSGLVLSLKNFINYYHLDPRSIYGKFSFYRLCVDAGVRADFNEPGESILTKAFSKLVAIDSRRWIKILLDASVAELIFPYNQGCNAATLQSSAAEKLFFPDLPDTRSVKSYSVY